MIHRLTFRLMRSDLAVRTLQLCQLTHCVKSVQMRSFFWSVFSRIRTEYGEILQMRQNTDQKKLRIWTLFTQ